MQKKEIPAAISTAATSMLAPYCPGLTPDKLQSAIMFDHSEEKIEKLLTRKDTASRLSISTVTLDRMIKAGEINARRIRGSVRIPESAVSAVING